MKPIGIYIHIPFCRSKCNYCDFYSFKGSMNDYTRYYEMLIRNIMFWKDKIENRTVDTIYIGGGTPSVLGSDLLLRLLSHIISSFNVLNEAEITIEVNPNSVSELDLNLIKSEGLNRLSMGLQSINDDELKLLGRAHNYCDTVKAIEHIKSSGIDNFSLDVMQGIPLQTIESLSKTIDFCVDAGAAHISTYMLKIEKNTPFYTRFKEFVFPREDIVADMYEFTCNKLIDNGYRHYEISNFCKDDRISKHNMKYWNLDDYIGIGPSAHSLLNNKRFYYPSDLESFDKNKIIQDCQGNTAEEYIMLSLRTDYGLDLNRLENEYRIIPSSSFKNTIEKFRTANLLEIDSNKIVLTGKGFLLSNTIILEIIDKI